MYKTMSNTVESSTIHNKTRASSIIKEVEEKYDDKKDIEMSSTSNGSVIDNFKDLHKKIKNLENAHRRCRDINKKFDTIINILILLTSTIVTCLEAMMDITDDNDMIQYLKIILAGTCASFAGLNQIFNNSEKAELHHSTTRLYFSLSNKIDLNIKLNKSYNDYKECLDEYTDIRRNSIGLFPSIRKIYKIY